MARARLSRCAGGDRKRGISQFGSRHHHGVAGATITEAALAANYLSIGLQAFLPGKVQHLSLGEEESAREALLGTNPSTRPWDDFANQAGLPSLGAVSTP